MNHKKYDRYELMAAREAWMEPASDMLSSDKKKIYDSRKNAVGMYIDGENKEFIEGNYFGYKEYTLEKNMNLTRLHDKFLQKCMDIGIGPDDYPFNTKSLGYQALRRYVKGIERSQVSLANRRTDRDSAQKAASTGYGENRSPLPVALFSCGQIDGHRIDLLYVTSIELDDGTEIEDVCERCWLLPVINMATRCVVGFHMSQESNYNQFDLLKSYQNALTPHESRAFSIEGIDYPDKKGFPSEVYPELNYAMFDEIMLDNAKSHLASNAEIIDI